MKLIKLSCVLAILLSATACVTGTREISLDIPPSSVSATKSGLIYLANIEDKREFEYKPKIPEIPSVKGKLESKTAEELHSYIGRQRNGYGIAMGSVALAGGQTVQDEVRKLLTAGIEYRGYQVAKQPGGNARSIDVDIEKFWAWFVPSLFTVGFESQLELTLKSSDGGISKTSVLSGKGNNEGQIASNANWALSYKRAYADLLGKLDAALEELGL